MKVKMVIIAALVIPIVVTFWSLSTSTTISKVIAIE